LVSHPQFPNPPPIGPTFSPPKILLRDSTKADLTPVRSTAGLKKYLFFLAATRGGFSSSQ